MIYRLVEWMRYGKQGGFIIVATNFRILRGTQLLEETVTKIFKMSVK